MLRSDRSCSVCQASDRVRPESKLRRTASTNALAPKSPSRSDMRVLGAYPCSWCAAVMRRGYSRGARVQATAVPLPPSALFSVDGDLGGLVLLFEGELGQAVLKGDSFGHDVALQLGELERRGLQLVRDFLHLLLEVSAQLLRAAHLLQGGELDVDLVDPRAVDDHLLLDERDLLLEVLGRLVALDDDLDLLGELGV